MMPSDERGYTIPEIMVSLVVSSLLVSMSLLLYLFAARLTSSWQKHVEAQERADRVIGRIMIDALRADKVSLDGDSLVRIESGFARTVRYRWSGEGLLRNEMSVLDSSLMNVRMLPERNDMEAFARHPEARELRVEVSRNDETLARMVIIPLRYSSRREFQLAETLNR